MAPTPRSRSLGAAELTLQAKMQSDDLLKASTPRSPWVTLQSPRSQSVPLVLKIDTTLEFETSPATSSKQLALHSPSDLGIIAFDQKKIIENDKILSSFNADCFLKLHALCSSSSSSIEMIRIYTSTYPWALKQRNSVGDLPLHVAIKRDDTSYMIICELLKKCPESAQIRDKNGDLPLFLACRRPKVNINVLRALIQTYPAAVHTKAYGNTALHHLLHTGNASPENVKLLISYNPAAVRTPNSFGNLPLHYLCASGNPHILTVHTVLESFPSGITTVNKSGETPIQRALAKNNDEPMRERVRIMLRASCSSARSVGQQDLLRQLNWEARRIVILLCVTLTRRSLDNNIPKKANTDEDYKEYQVLMDVYHRCDGVWRDIIAFL